MVDRVTTARLRADASQFKREIASAAAAAKALDAALGRGNIGGVSKGFDQASDSASRFDDELTNLNKNELIVVKNWNSDLVDLDANLVEAGGHVHTFRTEIDELDRSTRSAGGGFRNMGRELGLLDFGAAETQNRMKILSQAILAIGPAAIPALAAVGAGVAALAGQLTFAIAGAGTAALAFAGVGDALKALNTVALDPSVANLEKLRLAMDQLGPAGQDFVFFLQSARGELETLQNLAGAGFLPGLQDGMESLIDEMPQLENVISSVSATLGDLAARGGEAFGSDEWRQFFTYLATDANQILTSMGVALGNFVQGMASLITAFSPLTSSFSSGLQNMAESFAGWAATLDQDQGFREFVSYVKEITPQLLDTLTAIAGTLLALGKATQGIQGPALMAIEALANALTLFLETPFAGPLLALAAALGAVSTAASLAGFIGGSKLVNVLKLLPALLAAASGGMLGFAKSTDRAAMSWSRFGSMAGKTAAGVGIIALAMTDLDEQAGVSNTAMLALAGTFAGPWGVAAGAAVGATLDLISAYNALNSAAETAKDITVEDTGNLVARQAAIEDLTAKQNTFNDTMMLLGGPISGSIGNWLFGDQQQDEIDAFNKGLTDSIAVLNGLRNIGPGPTTYTDDLGKLTDAAADVQPVLDQMGITLTEAQTAWMDSGATRQQFINDFEQARAKMDSLAGRGEAVTTAIGDLDDAFLSTADSASALATALDSLISPYLGLVSAQDAWTTGLHDFESALSKSTDSLTDNTDGAIKNRAAFGGQVELLVGMIKAQAEAGKGSLFLAKSLESSREALIRVGLDAGLARKEMENFLDKAGLTPKLIRTTFEALGIDAAENEARNLADSYNKLPKEVRVAIKQDGVPQSERELDSLKRKYDLTPKQLKIVAELRDNASVKIAGLRAKIRQVDKETATPKADMDIKPFQLKAERIFDINRKIASERPNPQVHADTTEAERKLAEAQRQLKLWDTSEGEAEATVDDNATPTISDLLAQLARVDNYTATATITTVQRTVVQGGQAEGGLIRGPGGPTDDRAGVYALSNQEFVSRAASVDKYGADAYYALNSLRADRNQLRKAIGLAGGGLVGLAGGGKPGDRRTLSSGDVFDKTLRGDGAALTLKDLERAMRALRNEARDVVVAERALRKERQQSKDLTHKIAQAERDEHTSKERLHELHQREREQSKDLAKAEKELAKQREELSNATQKLKDRERELLAQARAISDAITAQGAIFGGEGTSVTAGGILSKLKSAVKDARQFKEDIATLRARGLDEDLIAQLYEQGSTPEGVQAVHNLATASKAMLAQINRQQRRLEHIGAATGTQSVRDQGRGGGNVIVNLNGPIKTTDVDRLAKQLPKEIRKALRIASSA